jgi:hypothetical protein
MVRAHNTMVRRAIALNAGTEVKHTGDGLMATFTSARRAVACAVAIQDASRFHNETHPELAFNIRIGLNAGEPVTEDNDVFGTAVQMTARVCARAEPGTILVSDVVRQLVAGKGLLFEDVGPVELKGFEESVHLFAIRSEPGGGGDFLEEQRLWRLLGATPMRVGMAITGLASVLAAAITLALVLSADDGGEPPSGAGAVAAPSGASITPSGTADALALPVADAEHLRDLIDRYSAKTIEALRTHNLAGLNALAVGEAFTQLADAVEELDSGGLVVEATRESVAIRTPESTGPDTASAQTLEIWTRCTYQAADHELNRGSRVGYDGTYHFVRSEGRWYLEKVDLTVSDEDEFDGCEACGALRAGCEAIVTNVAPLNLFVRAAADRDAQVKGRLPDRTVVCVTGTSQVADGLTWWPVRATIAAGPIEGWSADHEPNPPGAVLLTATGERCQ